MTVMEDGSTQPRLEIGNVLRGMSRAIGKNPATYFGLSFLLQGLPMLAIGVAQALFFSRMFGNFHFGQSPEEMIRLAEQNQVMGFPWELYFAQMGGLLLSTLLAGLLQAAVIRGVTNTLLERPTSFGDCLRTGLRYFLPAVGIGIVTTLGMVACAFAAVVPAFIFAFASCVATPAAVVEGKGVFGSVGRSWSLTNGYKGQIFVLFLMYVAVGSMANTLVQAVVTPFMFTSMAVAFWILGVAVQPLLYTITGVFTSAATASLYYELRRVKEGIGAEQLAQVFA